MESHSSDNRQVQSATSISSMHIVCTEHLTADQHHHLFEWREHVFDEHADGIECDDMADHYLLMDGTTVAGHAAAGVRTAECAGIRHPVVGIAAVVIRPEYQGRHFAVDILKHIHSQLGTAYHAQMALLFCMPYMVTHYKRAGYRLLNNRVFYQQSSGLVQCPHMSMVYEKDGAQIGVGDVTIASRPW